MARRGGKKKNTHKPSTGELFPGFKDKYPKSRIVREDINVGEYPIAVVRQPNKGHMHVIELNDSHRWILVGSEMVGGLPELHHLDYFYALVELLYERTRFETGEIYFTIHELILRAGKHVNKREYARALEALQRYRYLIIRSEVFRVAVGDKVKTIKEDISLLQYFSLVSGALTKGRKKAPEDSLDGYATVTFSEHFMANLRSDFVSKELNYAMRMRLSTPLARRYFSLIDSWRYSESKEAGHDVEEVVRDVFTVGRMLTLSENYKHPSLITRVLTPMHNELIELNYLQDYKYEKENGATYVRYVFSKFSTSETIAYDELLRKHVSHAMAEKLVKENDPRFILDVVAYCTLKGKTDAAYIIQTIRMASRESIESFLAKQREKEKKQRMAEQEKMKDKLRKIYEQEKEAMLDEYISGLPKKKREALEHEAREKVPNIGLGPTGIQLSVEGHLREIARANVKLPSFDEWLAENEGIAIS